MEAEAGGGSPSVERVPGKRQADPGKLGTDLVPEAPPDPRLDRDEATGSRKSAQRDQLGEVARLGAAMAPAAAPPWRIQSRIEACDAGPAGAEGPEPAFHAPALSQAGHKPELPSLAGGACQGRSAKGRVPFRLGESPGMAPAWAGAFLRREGDARAGPVGLDDEAGLLGRKEAREAGRIEGEEDKPRSLVIEAMEEPPLSRPALSRAGGRARPP